MLQNILYYIFVLSYNICLTIILVASGKTLKFFIIRIVFEINFLRLLVINITLKIELEFSSLKYLKILASKLPEIFKSS